MQTLPIDKVKSDFLTRLETDDPLIVAAPTGSGKSTRLPLWMDDFYDQPVLVVEPRRVACRSLASWLAKGRGEKPGESIGYRIRFDDTSSEQTEVLFATTGVALRLLENADFPFGAVLIDEFHERNWQVDLVAAVLRQRRLRESEPIPYVITSATLDIDQLSRELGAEVLEAEGRRYPVDVEYRDEPKMPTGRNLDRRVADAVEQTLQLDDEGDILVFLPGKGEIRDCYKALKGVSERGDAEVLKVHAQLPPHKLEYALESDSGRRRVYLATNVAETSITLPGVTTVIDSGLARMKIHRAGQSALALTPIAEDAMDQRAGRAGRVQPGRCIRLWSRRFRPQPTTPPEIERIELDDVLLHAGACGIDGPQVDEAPWVTDPPEFALKQAQRRLEAVGALDSDRKLTTMGRKLASLPVDGHDARILIDAPAELAGTLCDIVALLQVTSPIILRANESKDPTLKHDRNQLFADCDNEVECQIRAIRHGNPGKHKLHRNGVREARGISKDLRELIGVDPVKPTRDAFELPATEKLASFLLDRIPESAFVLRKRARQRRGGRKPKLGKPEPWTNGDYELKVWPYRPPGTPEDKEVEYPEAGIILDQFWMGRGYASVEGTGDLVLPASDQLLARAEVGRDVIERVEVKGSDPPRIYALVHRKLAKVVLEQKERALTGRKLCEGVATVVMQGRLFEGVAQKLLRALHIWDLLANWPDEDRYWEGPDTTPEPESFLRQKLETLGLETAEDLILIEPEDLLPDLTSVFGLPKFEIKNFKRDFPRQWEHQGAIYKCETQPTTEKVFLEPSNKKARKAKEPRATHVPKFRGFSVYYRRESRVVPVRP